MAREHIGDVVNDRGSDPSIADALSMLQGRHALQIA